MTVSYLFEGKVEQADRKWDMENFRGCSLCELLEGDQPLNRLNNEIAEMIGANRQPRTASVVTEAKQTDSQSVHNSQAEEVRRCTATRNNNAILAMLNLFSEQVSEAVCWPSWCAHILQMPYLLCCIQLWCWCSFITCISVRTFKLYLRVSAAKSCKNVPIISRCLPTRNSWRTAELERRWTNFHVILY